MLIIGGLIYRNYRQKQKLQQQRINELETEKQLMAAEAVMKGEDKERSRIAKDLHDGLGGMLSGIKHSFQHMKDNLVMTPDNQQAFERSMDMLDSSIKELRRVAHNMMPEALVKFGLDVALKDFCNSVNQSGAVELTYESFGLEKISLDQQTAISIYRMVQELVNNTLKHAAASKAIVQISKTADGLTITVEDDGHGFDTQILQSTKGMGWSNLQSRIDYLKGKLNVQSAPGKGTSVLIEITT
jgi:signal transduction histidine kinase